MKEKRRWNYLTTLTAVYQTWCWIPSGRMSSQDSQSDLMYSIHNISPTLGSHRQHRWSRYQAVLIDMVSQVAPDTPWPDLDRLGWENEFASNWAAGGPNTPSDSDAKLVLSSQSAGDNEKILWHHTLTGLLSNDLCQVNWNFLFLIFNLKSVCP